MIQKKIDENYSLREMSSDEFTPLFEKFSKQIFDEEGEIFRFREHLTQAELQRAKDLKSNMGSPYVLRIGVFEKDNFVGWFYGFQESAETFYMCNSAIFEEHRLKGLYSALLNVILETVIPMGFQRIYSRHALTNNAILIPKLKAGFVITTFEASDMFGILVHLTYFPKAIRRKVLDYRIGQIKRDEELNSIFK